MDFEVTYTEDQPRFRHEVRAWLEANETSSSVRSGGERPARHRLDPPPRSVDAMIDVLGARDTKIRARSDSLRRQILESNTATAPQRFSGRRYSPQELGMVLQPIVEPVVLALEADQHASRLPVSGDEDFLGFSQAQESRQVVLDLSQRRPAHRASRARQASRPLRLS